MPNVCRCLISSFLACTLCKNIQYNMFIYKFIYGLCLNSDLSKTSKVLSAYLPGAESRPSLTGLKPNVNTAGP